MNLGTGQKCKNCKKLQISNQLLNLGKKYKIGGQCPALKAPVPEIHPVFFLFFFLLLDLGNCENQTGVHNFLNLTERLMAVNFANLQQLSVALNCQS